MNSKAPHHILFAILAVVALMLVSCGGNEDLAKKLGCPSGSIMANSDDVVVATSKEPTGLQFYAGPSVPYTSLTLNGGYTLPYSMNYGPVIFSVWAPVGGLRKNNICVVLNTDGYFWDPTFTTLVGEVTAYGRRLVTKTDVNGEIILWWSTQDALSSAASGSTAGADVSASDLISASSGGAQPASWNAGYTVKGCPVGAVCP